MLLPEKRRAPQGGEAAGADARGRRIFMGKGGTTRGGGGKGGGELATGTRTGAGDRTGITRAGKGKGKGGGGLATGAGKGGGLLLPRYDVTFKSIFKGKGNEDVVEDFLRAALGIEGEAPFEDIAVEDPEMLPDAAGEKLSILDVLLRVPGRGIFNVEMQLCRLPEMRERLVFYWARMAARQLSAGQGYAALGKAASVVIADFDFIGGGPGEYFHRYVLYDPERGSLLTDLVEFDIIELRKVPAEPDGTARWEWARFFASRTDDELYEAASRNEKIGKAMIVLEKLSADENARFAAEREEMMRRDYVSRMEGALREGEALGRAEGEALGRAEGEALGRAAQRAEIARRMAELGMGEAEIAAVLGTPD
jgi:predicted transposase/invertase (TIGR01784 family)